MTLTETFTAQLAAYEAAATAEFRWRPLMMRAVLDVSPPSVIREAWSAVDPKSPPSDSTLRRMVARTRDQMGLPELPVSEGKGRTPASFYDPYRKSHCAKWLRLNGGYPRMEQLVDPHWDLKPCLPPSEAAEESESGKEVTQKLHGSVQDSRSIQDSSAKGAEAPNNSQTSATEAPRKSQSVPEGKAGKTLKVSSGNPITQGMMLEDKLHSLPVDAEYPQKAWGLKLEIHRLYQDGQEASFSERQGWKDQIRQTMASAGIAWDEGLLAQ
jgi:hypothetical protein